ncbi:ABC transporter permease [Streptomyces sp. NBC_01262]|uniref:ABC transporter permease n=1 Tax=Streptomyces sp. NBC_01262 TaxID=2903803 RepID=UPI002E3369CF|nr:ABC transporter permease [Streptomyces sp. NBC_01262]
MSVSLIPYRPSTPASARTGSGLRLRGLTWLVWRQNRLAFWIGLGVAAAVAAYSIVRHQEMVTAIAQGHLDACRGTTVPAGTCANKLVAFGQTYQYPMRRPLQAMLALPLLFGVFLGGPQLAQELESGTYRTVCTQSVTRLRWFAAKLLVPVALTVVISGTIAAAMTWWWQPAGDLLGAWFPWYQWYPYDGIGPVLVGLSVLSLLIGVTAGLILRRTVLAMGATVVLGAGAMYLLESVRGHLLPTTLATVQHTTGSAAPADAWVLAEGPVNATGQRVPDLLSCYAADDYSKCLVQHGRTGRWAEFHPASHLWPLQWAETGLCLLLAAALTGLCVQVIRHRLA